LKGLILEVQNYCKTAKVANHAESNARLQEISRKQSLFFVAVITRKRPEGMKRPPLNPLIFNISCFFSSNACFKEKHSNFVLTKRAKNGNATDQ
jgi:hypothetical protein